MQDRSLQDAPRRALELACKHGVPARQYAPATTRLRCARLERRVGGEPVLPPAAGAAPATAAALAALTRLQTRSTLLISLIESAAVPIAARSSALRACLPASGGLWLVRALPRPCGRSLPFLDI